MSVEGPEIVAAEPTSPPPASLDWPADPAVLRHQGRNLLLLVAQQTVFRVGWIFKTESVIMPAFLDWVAGPGAGVWRGFLPVLNRFGQSIPPVFSARRLRAARLKKRVLAAMTVLAAVPFAVLAAVCRTFDVTGRTWMPLVFLVLYGAFSVIMGLYYLASGTVQGKLIRPTRRGRLLSMATFLGTIPAMAFAAWLLPKWLEGDAPGYAQIFSFTSVCFFLSGLTVLLLWEPADSDANEGPSADEELAGSLEETWQTLKQDANLRRLVLVTMLFGTSLIIFPHYQALARERLGLGGGQLTWWVVTQNAAVGTMSLFVGPLADSRGYRLTLRLLMFAAALPPALASSLPHLPGAWGARLFLLVFVPLGVTPLVMRAAVNYALEISRPADHPRYLSTLSLCLALPFVFSPAVGWLVDVLGFEPVFLCTAGAVIAAALLTFRLDEPRHRGPHETDIMLAPASDA